MSELHWTARRCTAAEALAAGGGQATVLVAAPDVFAVAVCDGDCLLRTADAHPWPLPARTFQIAAFDGTTELRWLADGDSGQAVWLAESAADLPDPAAGTVPFAEKLDDRAVLWGLPDSGDREGFSVWSDGRIGAATYPTPPGVGRAERACLSVVEYVDYDEHGNAAVVERRLVAITTEDLAG